LVQGFQYYSAYYLNTFRDCGAAIVGGEWGFMEYAVEKDSGDMMYIPSLMTIVQAFK
jgi:hypothetical protein